ncbi:hypothetical protein KC930_03800 [Candidatus Saccharibacteria bacterium]|nr:hypothetical protein [Candidatus Saccharibacteria bacterium]
MINNEELRMFLNKADKPHADGTAVIKRGSDGSSTIEYVDGKWSMHDNFFGGEPYGGRQIVRLNGEPVWMCLYYGAITDKTLNVHEVYDFLRKSLQKAPVNGFSRGPKSFKSGSFEYRNVADGDITSYHGHETIFLDGEKIYWADYMGGLVDQHAKGEY